MKVPNLKILDESNKILRQTSSEVTFPIDENLKQTLLDSIEYLKASQDEEIAEKCNLRAGMGLAMVQLGIKKRAFVIANKNEDTGNFEEYIVINPRIISQSEELIYVGEGEGCLSVNRETTGIVPRHARINVEYQDFESNTIQVRVREEIAIAFQHEIDHLNGILFVDKIDKKNPFKDANKMREI